MSTGPTAKTNADIADARTRQLVGVLVLALCVIVVGAVVTRAALEPSLLAGDLPIAALALATFAGVFWLNRTRFHRVAAFAFCLNPVWLNLIEGLHRPDGPVWYALLPMAGVLGAAFLRFRAALAIAIVSVAGALLVVMLRSDLIPAERGSLIVMYVALMNTAALGMAVFRDRVERARRVELERLAGQLAATERLESIGRLAGGVAHDFNNLLTVIIGSAEIARMGELEALDEVLVASERAASLTRQLLAFSRHRGGQRISVAVDDAIEAVRPLLRRLLPENIELVVQLDAGSAIELEDQQLEQILFNLAANARDAMREGGTLTIQTTRESVPIGAPEPKRAGEFVVIEVQDTGEGMDDDTRARLFEPFFTTKPIGEGTGLGLGTVRGIVRQAGGWMLFDSAPNEGTRVTLGFPQSAPRAAEITPAAPASVSFSGWVLVVEDEPLVRAVTARTLESLGFSVLTASRADEVPSVLATAPVPLVLLVTDVVMPGRSGAQLAQELRDQHPNLPVLIISGYAEEDLQSFLSQPATALLPKPFARADLLQAVSALLRARA